MYDSTQASIFNEIDRAVAVAQEFHISVTPLGNDQYLVRIEDVAPGVPLAEEQVQWPVDEWLAKARQLMNDPLWGLFHGTIGGVDDIFPSSVSNESVSSSCLNLVALGQQLYNALFQGSLRDSWMMAQAIAQNQRQVLRLRLGLKGNRLPRLPWEVLHEGNRPLATGTDVAFSRYQPSTGLMRPLQELLYQANQPLKILMVIAGPSDQESLELAQEAAHLQEELKNRSRHELPAIQLTILEQPGREQLTQALEQGQYQVFHYAGHSSLGDSGGDVYLVSNKTGLTETLNGDDLAGLLANNGVQLAVFNSCRGAYTATSDPLDNGKDRNLAEALVKQGIPGVLAMAERIPDEVALTLTRLLYRNLNQGYPIDLSLSRARQGLISAYGSNQLYWALPVLYLHSKFDGFLTNVSDNRNNREERLLLPELSETSVVSSTQETLFTPSPGLNSTSFLEDDLASETLDPLPGFDDEEFSDWMDEVGADEEADDPSIFIRGLLNQLDTPAASNESVLPGLNAENSARTAPDTGEFAVNDRATPPQESAVPISSAAITQSPPTPPAKTATASAAAQPAQPRRSKSGWQLLRSLPRLWMVVGITSMIAIAVLGAWFFWNRQPRLEGGLLEPDPSVPSLPQSTTSKPVDLAKADTSTVTNIAIEQFNQENIAAGGEAVEALLDRGALPQAEAALVAIPPLQLERPTISFLRGRLAWQAIQAGSENYNLDDVRRYWETAVKGQPDSPQYLNALGFAFYAEGDFERANNAWLDALTQIETESADASEETPNNEALTSYAGLALGFWKSAQEQPAPKRANLLNESSKLRQKVLQDEPVNFQPDALSKNWLWSEQAIQDWRSLLASEN